MPRHRRKNPSTTLLLGGGAALLAAAVGAWWWMRGRSPDDRLLLEGEDGGGGGGARKFPAGRLAALSRARSLKSLNLERLAQSATPAADSAPGATEPSGPPAGSGASSYFYVPPTR